MLFLLDSSPLSIDSCQASWAQLLAQRRSQERLAIGLVPKNKDLPGVSVLPASCCANIELSISIRAVEYDTARQVETRKKIGDCEEETSRLNSFNGEPSNKANKQGEN